MLRHAFSRMKCAMYGQENVRSQHLSEGKSPRIPAVGKVWDKMGKESLLSKIVFFSGHGKRENVLFIRTGEFWQG